MDTKARVSSPKIDYIRPSTDILLCITVRFLSCMKKWKNILYHVLTEFEVYEAFRSNQKSLALLIATTRIISHPGKCRWVYFG